MEEKPRWLDLHLKLEQQLETYDERILELEKENAELRENIKDLQDKNVAGRALSPFVESVESPLSRRLPSFSATPSHDPQEE